MTTKILAILIFIFGFSLLNAQYFEVLGDRRFQFEGWDGGDPNNTYFDSEGNYYIYTRETSQPRSNELIRYDFEKDAFEDISKQTFSLEGGVSTSSSVGFSDGSMFVVSSTFFGKFIAHHYMKDGTFELLGDNPVSGGGIAYSAMDSKGNFYVAASGQGSLISKYDGARWISLQSVNNSFAETIHFLQLHFDENDNLYASYIKEAGIKNEFYIQEYNPDEDLWSTRAFLANINYNSRASFVSSSEAYVMVTDVDDITFRIYRYDGNGLELLGAPFEYQKQEGGDIYMSKQGTLYAALGEDMYSFDFSINRWNKLERNFIDGNTGKTSGFKTYINEDANGRIYNSFHERNSIGENGMTTVIFTPQYVSVKDNEFASEVKVYPNPSTDFITIESQYIIKNVKIFSLDGKLVNETNKTKIDVSEFPSGIYSVEVSSKDKVATIKVLIGK